MAVFPFKQKHKQEYTFKKLNVVNFLFLRVDKTCLKSCFFNYDHPILIFQDYPSVGQIIQKAKENNINIIFVIGGNSSAISNEKVRQLFYDKLATLLPGGTEKASELSTDASNILQIVSDNYRVSVNK